MGVLRIVSLLQLIAVAAVGPGPRRARASRPFGGARPGGGRPARPAGTRGRTPDTAPRHRPVADDPGGSVPGGGPAAVSPPDADVLRDVIRGELAALLDAARAPAPDSGRHAADVPASGTEPGVPIPTDGPDAATATGTMSSGTMGTGTMNTGTTATGTSLAALAEAQAELDRTRNELETVQRAVITARQEAETARRDSDTVRHEADGVRQEADAIRREAENIRRAAHTDAEAERRSVQAEGAELLQQARARIGAERGEAKAEADERRRELERQRAEIEQDTRVVREERDTAATAAAELAARAAELDVRATDLRTRGDELDRRAGDLDRAAAEHDAELARISGLTAADARAELMASVQSQSTREAAILARDIEDTARAKATERARRVVVEAVQRVASAQTAETVVSVMPLPGDEMKGRIIGREGRNIRAFEAVTGVNVIIDDTPEAVLLSCFDPVRRETGRLTLEKLVLDGRIHPHRIEEAFEQSKIEVDELCRRAATDALAEMGITDLDERLVPTLGRLRYRTSYGQNVLGHLLESGHVAGIMAAELGLEPTLIKRCAFLHDIGKALTHEVEGSHAIVGAELLRKYGESEAVAHAVEAHHNEVQPTTVEAVLTQASDACSAARPGARREALEAYVNRLKRVEEIASSRPGVEKVFAMQAGREVRVMVTPDDVDDLAAQVIAREVAKQIEDELTYPGQIRVTVVRETRASETAH